MEFLDEIVDYDVNLLNQYLAEIIQFYLQVSSLKQILTYYTVLIIIT